MPHQQPQERQPHRHRPGVLLEEDEQRAARRPGSGRADEPRVQLRAVGRREPHVLVVEAEAVRVEGDFVGHSRDAGDVYLFFFFAAVKKNRGRRWRWEREWGERERGRRSRAAVGCLILLFLFFSVKKINQTCPSHQPLLEPVEQAQS